MAGRGGLNLTHSEPLPAFLARYREAAPRLEPAISSVSAGSAAGMERGARAADLCRLERACVSRKLQGLAAVARVAAAAGFGGRAVRVPSSLDRVGRSRRAQVSDAGGRTRRSKPARPCSRSAAQAGRGWAPTAAGRNCSRRRASRSRRCGRPIAASRSHGPMSSGIASRASRSRASQFRFGRSAIRGEAIITRSGIEGGAIYALSAELREAIAGSGEATLRSRCGPISTRAIWSSGCPRRAASSRSPISCARRPTCRRLRSACCRRRRLRRASPLASLSPAELAALINAVPIQLTGVAPIARAISTAGGICLRRARRRFHAAQAARRVRRRRDAGLGSADRRLSACRRRLRRAPRRAGAR